MLDIESIKAREQAATEGPWEAVSLDEYGVRYVGDEEEYHPAWTVPQAMQIGNGESAFMLREDAEFAAHAREDIRALIAEVERLRQVASISDSLPNSESQ